MKIHLDDDTVDSVLIKLLRAAGHDVATPSEANMAGETDPLHLAHAIRSARPILTHNHDDFENLDELLFTAGGKHAGIIVIRKDNDAARDLSPRGIVTAIRELEQSGIPVENEFIILNHWR